MTACDPLHLNFAPVSRLKPAIQDLNIINTHDEQYNLTLYLKDGGIVSAENQRLDLFSRDTKCVYMRDMKGRYAVEVEFDISGEYL